MQPPTPEDLFERGGKPLHLDLRCTRCQKEAAFEVPWAMVSSQRERDAPDGWDGVVLARMFTCPACGAVDEYVLTAISHLKLTAEMLQGTAGLRSARVMRGEARLWDGTPLRRPAQGLAHLRALAERQPPDAQAWRRLGNFCERYGLPDEAERAWRRAVEHGPDEFEAAYSLAEYLLRRAADADPNEAVGYLFKALERFPRAQEFTGSRRRDFAEAMATLLFEVVDQTDLPMVLTAGWSSGVVRGQPVVNLSAVDLRALERRDGLGPFLARPEVILLRMTADLPEEGTTRLHDLLERGADGALPDGALPPTLSTPAPIRVAPKPGRNEPCPCGSGKKYKKCHGA
jgi:hypothetical protein